MRIRQYKPGDEKSITPNEFMTDWESDTYKNHEALQKGTTHTIVDDHGTIQAIVNNFLIEGTDNVLYGWFLRDINANPLFITKVKKILKNYLQSGFIVATISKEGKMQDRMHEYLGFKKVRKIGGNQLWVAQ